jgi:hypothetical protein
MSKYLISVTETYRVDTEAEAAVLIDEAKKDNKYDLKKYTSQKKERKQKGEVVDEWHQVVLTKIFDDEKEPIGAATVEYKVGGIYE